MNELEQAIENLYSTFGVYTTEGIHYCNCGCVKEENVKKLHSKPLRELENEDLISYHGSALYTWGDVEHYKHYLPRICELISVKRDFGYVTLDEVKNKLDFAEWTNWPENERKAILDYVICDWVDFSTKNISEISDIEIARYAVFFNLEDVLSNWKILDTESALSNFVHFFYFHGSQIFNSGLRIGDRKYKQEFLDWVDFDKIIPKLEQSYFDNESINIDLANKISIVLQMIEQQMKINGR